MKSMIVHGTIKNFVLAFAKCCKDEPDKFTPEVCSIFLEVLANYLRYEDEN